MPLQGEHQLDEMIRAIERVGSLDHEALRDCSRELQQVIEKNISDVVDPDGKPWQRKRDGSAPLKNAAAKVSVAPIDENSILVLVGGPEARHSRGLARGGIVRAIVPNSLTIPAGFAAALQRGIARAFDRIMGGSK